MADNKKSTSDKTKSAQELEAAKRKKARRDKRRKRRKVRRIIIGYLFLIFALVAVIGGYVAYEKFGKNILAYRDAAQEIVANSDENSFRQDETSIVYLSLRHI